MKDDINITNQNSFLEDKNTNPFSKKTKINYWIILSISLLFISLMEFFLLNKEIFIKLTRKSNRNDNKNILIVTSDATIKNIEWKTITSERAKFSFKYPSSWPITFLSEEKLQDDNRAYDETNIDPMEDYKNILKIEAIDFSEKFENGNLDKYGSIFVQKQTRINSLDDYIKYYDVESKVWGKGQTAVIPRPKIKYSVIAGEVAATFFTQDGFLADLSSTNTDLEYRIFKNGLIYYFAASKSDRFIQNEELNIQIFKNIIESVKFLN